LNQRTIEFGRLTIVFDDDVLEPRPWTIAQSEWAIEVSPEVPDGSVLELGCGAGHIGLVVGATTGRALVQVDDDEHACGLARANAAAAGVTTDVRCGTPDDALDPTERFSLVLADPPYLVDAPGGGHAVDGGVDGLQIARTWLGAIADHVASKARVVFQIGGQHQADSLIEHATGLGFVALETRVHRADRALVLFSAGT
jgi:methylase of polypeptide subunit release factors